MNLSNNEIEELRQGYRVDPNSEEFKIALENVKQMVFHKKFPVSENEIPTMVFIGGQQGSGKTQLLLSKDADSDNFVRLSIDECTPFHPHRGEIVDTHPDLYAYFTYEFGLMIRNEIYNEAVEKRYNVRTEGTLKDTEDTLKLIRQLRESRYRVEIEVMATGITESSLSVFERYETEIEEQKEKKKKKESVPRLVEWTSSYGAIPNTIKQIEEDCVADSIKIFTRGVNEHTPNLKYATDAERNNYDNAYECLTTERKLDNIRSGKTFVKRFNKLERSMIARGATDRELMSLRNVPKELNEKFQIDISEEREAI